MHEKLLNIQRELKVPKNQFNSFGKYKYRSCEDIIEAVKPLCHAQELILTLSDEVVEVGGRNYVKATAKLVEQRNDHEALCSVTRWRENPSATPRPKCICGGVPEEKGISVTGYAREEETKKGMDGSQITGAASSYARKYALNGLFAIDDAQDSDSTNTHGKEQSKDVADYPPTPTEEPVIRR